MNAREADLDVSAKTYIAENQAASMSSSFESSKISRLITSWEDELLSTLWFPSSSIARQLIAKQAFLALPISPLINIRHRDEICKGWRWKHHHEVLILQSATKSNRFKTRSYCALIEDAVESGFYLFKKTGRSCENRQLKTVTPVFTSERWNGENLAASDLTVLYWYIIFAENCHWNLLMLCHLFWFDASQFPQIKLLAAAM